jgi:hypothetical protein
MWRLDILHRFALQFFWDEGGQIFREGRQLLQEDTLLAALEVKKVEEGEGDQEIV